MTLDKNELEKERLQLKIFIKNHFTNTSFKEINEKIDEITIWCQNKNYDPF